jgi:hypothetical protein
MLLRRPGYKLDINAILRACAEYIWEGVLPRKMRATECLLGVDCVEKLAVALGLRLSL